MKPYSHVQCVDAIWCCLPSFILKTNLFKFLRRNKKQKNEVKKTSAKNCFFFYITRYYTEAYNELRAYLRGLAPRRHSWFKPNNIHLRFLWKYCQYSTWFKSVNNKNYLVLNNLWNSYFLMESNLLLKKVFHVHSEITDSVVLEMIDFG